MSWIKNGIDTRGRWKALVFFYNLNGKSKCFWSREKQHPTWHQQRGLDDLKKMSVTYLGKYSGISIYDCEYSKDNGVHIMHYNEFGVCDYKLASR